MSISEILQFYDIIAVVEAVYQVCLFYILWHIFFQSASEWATLAFGGALLLANAALELPPYAAVNGLRFAISAALVLVYSLIRYRRHCEKAVLALTIFYGFHSFDFLVSRSFHQLLEEYASRFWEELDEIGAYDPTSYLWTFYTEIAGQIFYILLFLLMLFILKKVFQPGYDANWYGVCFLSVINLVGGLFVRMFMEINLVTFEGRTFDLISVKPALKWMLPLAALLLYLGEMAAITVYQGYHRLQRERERIFMEQQQAKAMRLRLEEAENFYQSIRQVRHDMKSHMTNIKGLIAGEAYGEVAHYIEKLDGAMEELEYKYTTGNALMDVIINNHYKRARKAEILFFADFCCQELEGIDVFELGIVLHNLLDNAVTACEAARDGDSMEPEKTTPYIHLSCRCKNNFLLLKVENSFNGSLKQDKDGLPKTSKEVNLPELLMEHGIGLRHVKDISERYLGSMSIEAENSIFKVMVMMQKPASAGTET